MKKFVAGLMAGIVLMTCTTALAETKQTIEAIFGQIKLIVDGKPVDKETLLYNGTTYVPLRAAAEALGKEVSYDDATKTAYIGNASQTDSVNDTDKFYPNSDNVPNFLYVVGIPKESEIAFEYPDGSGAQYRYKIEYVTNADITTYQRALNQNGYVSDGTGTSSSAFYSNGNKKVMITIEDDIYFQISFGY